jgi:hypothetical protein
MSAASISRRRFARGSLTAGLLTALGGSGSPGDSAPAPSFSGEERLPTANEPVVDLGTRRELMVDRFLGEHWRGVDLKLHEPQLAPPTPEPADLLEYGTVILDGALYRLYTRDGRGAQKDGDPAEVTRYCESDDGIHWRKPKLGLWELDGTTANNVILHEPPCCHNFSPFLDRRPGVPPGERFKALAGTQGGGGLVAFASGDGIRWSRIQPGTVIASKEFSFDSQNVAFWSEAEGCYVCFFRTWLASGNEPFHWNAAARRSVSRTTSMDFRNWTTPVALRPNFPGEHLYTTQTHPYFRAPHFYVALPTRFHPDRGESTDILFMTARGNRPFDRTFREAFIRPGLDPARWGNRSNYAALNVVPTGPSEMSIYTTPFRRFTLRTDGFASLHAGADLGEWVSRPVQFSGRELSFNFATSAGGSLRVELQSTQGHPLPGFTLADCAGLIGDSLDQRVRWRESTSVESLAGRPVRLRVILQEADLFSFQFPGSS